MVREETDSLPDFVEKEFYEYLRCGILAHGKTRNSAVGVLRLRDHLKKHKYRTARAEKIKSPIVWPESFLNHEPIDVETCQILRFAVSDPSQNFLD